MFSAVAIPQWVALRFTDSKISSPDNISELRRPKNIKFGTQVASSTRMMCALTILEKFFNVAKLAKNSKNMPKVV